MKRIKLASFNAIATLVVFSVAMITTTAFAEEGTSESPQSTSIDCQNDRTSTLSIPEIKALSRQCDAVILYPTDGSIDSDRLKERIKSSRTKDGHDVIAIPMEKLSGKVSVFKNERSIQVFTSDAQIFSELRAFLDMELRPEFYDNLNVLDVK